VTVTPLTALRRVVQLTTLSVASAAGVLLALTASGAVSDDWRDDAADAFRDIARPDLADWELSVLGAALVLVGVLTLLALLSSDRGDHRRHEVHQTDRGRTRIRRRAVMSAVRGTVERVPHVTRADVRWPSRTVTVEAHVDDGADLVQVETAIRDGLGHRFWIDMRCADVGVEIVVVHDGRPSGTTRVR